jgi:hypothetical protein
LNYRNNEKEAWMDEVLKKRMNVMYQIVEISKYMLMIVK